MESKHDESFRKMHLQKSEQPNIQMSESERQRILNEAAGLWRDRDDLPDWRKLRASWDCKFGE
jgi:hypothetical protein